MIYRVYRNNVFLGTIDTAHRTTDSPEIRCVLARLATQYHPTDAGWTEELLGVKILFGDIYFVAKSLPDDRLRLYILNDLGGRAVGLISWDGTCTQNTQSVEPILSETRSRYQEKFQYKYSLKELCHPRLQELNQAYRSTEYRVEDSDPPFSIHIGEPSESLELLLESSDCERWAFLTAYNPSSESLGPEENESRSQQLEQEVTRLGFPFFRGSGIGTDCKWPPEPSLLILGIDETNARELAYRFGQNAFVFGRRGQPARLIWVIEILWNWYRTRE